MLDCFYRDYRVQCDIEKQLMYKLYQFGSCPTSYYIGSYGAYCTCLYNLIKNSMYTAC